MSRRRGGSRPMRARKARLPAHATLGWLARLDGRSLLARTATDRLAELTTHLGGDTEVTAIERSLVDRLLHAEMLAMRLEAEVRDGTLKTPSDYLAVTDRVIKLATTLGLRRRARPVSSLAEIRREYAANGTPKDAAP